MLKYIEKRNDNSFLLHVNIKPNSRKQEIIIDDENLIIRVKSKANQNKANKELLGLLRKKVGVSPNQIMIVSGLRSSNKVIELKFIEQIDENQLLKRLN